MIDSERAATVAGMTKADAVRYACEQLGHPSTAEVREWLVTAGVQVTRPYASGLVAAWRKERGLSDTGDMLPLTPELLAELDSLRLPGQEDAGAAASGPVESLEAPERADITIRPLEPATEPVGGQGVVSADSPRRKLSTWPLILIALPAFVAIWAGWVGLGEMAGFGPVNLLPGLGEGLTLNIAITLPIGVEVYAALALKVWLSSNTPPPARRFARWSAIGSLALGMVGQVAYHLMVAAGVTTAPWVITTLVSCLPVAVLGAAAALWHMAREES